MRVVAGEKTFEIRKNDRNFQAGDTVLLVPYHGKKKINEPWIGFTISYVTAFMQKDGWVVFGIKPTESKPNE